MSGRVPAGEILNEAFQFGFYRWLTVFRFAWAPLAFTAVLMWALINAIFDKEALAGIEKAADLERFSDIMNVSPVAAIVMGIGAAIVTMIAFAGMFASVYRLVALGEDRPGFLQIRFDGPAQRVFMAQIILNAVNYVIGIAAVLIGLTFAGASLGDLVISSREFFALVHQTAQDPSFQPSEAQIQSMAGPLRGIMLGGLIAAPALIFVNVKLSPFLAGSAAENRLLLFGAFRLTAGYFWAIFGVIFMFILALFAVGLAFSLVMSFVETMSNLGGSLAFIGALFGVISFAATVFYQVFIIGVQLSLQAIIYRRLKTGE